jgi:tetratricopeptide (TPR) repeat protein
MALSIAASVWNSVGDDQIDAKDYEGGRTSRRKAVEAGEIALGMDPGNLSWSRNVSLYYKKLGALLEFLDAVDDAIPLYQRAMALDRDRIEREPGRLLSRLDLSFAHGSMGSALRRTGDLHGALEQYRQAIALRQEVVSGDPKDDFAQTSVAYGYERISAIQRQLGDVLGAIDSQSRRVDIYKARLAAHPEREHVWRELAATASTAIASCLDALALPGATPQVQRAGLVRVGAMIDVLASTRLQWARDKRPGSLPPTDDELRRLTERYRRMRGK